MLTQSTLGSSLSTVDFRNQLNVSVCCRFEVLIIDDTVNYFQIVKHHAPACDVRTQNSEITALRCVEFHIGIPAAGVKLSHQYTVRILLGGLARYCTNPDKVWHIHHFL